MASQAHSVKPVQQGINVCIPQQQAGATSQSLATTLISPINSQSSPSVQSVVTPTKSKRRDKEKNLNVSAASAGQVSCSSAGTQSQAQSSQSRTARSTQHQLTVAQLLSQKHQQQQQKSHELSRSMSSPLTVPALVQVSEQANCNGSTGSLVSSGQNGCHGVKVACESEATSSTQSTCGMPRTSIAHFSNCQPNAPPSLSIPTPLSQSTKILLNETNAPSPQTVTCIPISSLGFGQSNGLLAAESARDADNCDVPSQCQSNDGYHECSSKRAMVECQKCMLFCHHDCVYLKKVDSRGEPMRLCAGCFNEQEKKCLVGD
ncbi:hypothetical protein BpHYR1_043583 [Brachionus plicatilis]|uniref:Uncharacterized protein n=1 Tax=Brachionus plicatilis TaxID=10195 RepID=A0A3M7Q2G2_BRAPC|nr:hypothetical protein BpHYR1_043583 [Brachionus plicatilis]